MDIEILMHLLYSEIEHIRNLVEMQDEAAALEFIWSELETKLSEQSIIKGNH